MGGSVLVDDSWEHHKLSIPIPLYDCQPCFCTHTVMSRLRRAI